MVQSTVWTAPVVGHGVSQELHATECCLIYEHLAEGHTGMIVYSQMHCFPANASIAMLALARHGPAAPVEGLSGTTVGTPSAYWLTQAPMAGSTPLAHASASPAQPGPAPRPWLDQRCGLRAPRWPHHRRSTPPVRPWATAPAGPDHMARSCGIALRQQHCRIALQAAQHMPQALLAPALEEQLWNASICWSSRRNTMHVPQPPSPIAHRHKQPAISREAHAKALPPLRCR
jgi:hypothetical protein